MAYENMKLIKQLNQISFFGLKGIKVGDVLSAATWEFKDWTNEFIKRINIYTVRGFDFEIIGENPDMVFVFSHNQINRIDQLLKFRAFTALFENRADIMAKQEGKAINPFLPCIPIWYCQMKKLRYSSIVKKGICYKLCEAMGYVNEIELLLKKIPNAEKIICFFDVTAVDSLLIQKYNQKQIDTYTLQHGIINGSYDYIEYKCSHAKYMLAWGEYTKKIAIHYGASEKKIKVVGNLNYFLNPETNLKLAPKQSRYFAVCTNGVLSKEDWKRNKELIAIANKIAEKYEIKYYLKIHPRDEIKKYEQLVNSNLCMKIVDLSTDIIEILEKVEFTVCGNSTTFCDSIYYGVPSFRYIRSEDRSRDVCKGIKFGRIENYEDVVISLEMLKDKSKEYEKKMMKIRNMLFEKCDVVQEYKNAILG